MLIKRVCGLQLGYLSKREVPPRRGMSRARARDQSSGFVSVCANCHVTKVAPEWRRCMQSALWLTSMMQTLQLLFGYEKVLVRTKLSLIVRQVIGAAAMDPG